MSKEKAKRKAGREKKGQPFQPRYSRALPAQLAWWREKKLWIPLLITLALTFTAFIPSLNNDLTDWDDPVYVTENTLIRGLSANHLKRIFTTPVSSNYHPLTILSLALNYQVSEDDPFGYHLTNLIIHLLNTVLVFAFIYLISGRKMEIAFITALFFGIHPMHVESVAWVSERKDVLYTFFFLSALISFFRYSETEKSKYYWASLGLFLLSALSKSAAVVLPVVLLLVDYLLERPLRRKVLIEKIPFFIGSLIFGLIAIETQSNAIKDFETFTLIQRMMIAAYGFVMYIINLFVPTNLSAFYPYPSFNTKSLTLIHIAPVLALGLVGLMLWSLRRTRVVFFGIAFYLVTVALVLQFITVGGAAMADRYTYVPYIGLFFLIGSFYHYISETKGRSVQWKSGLMSILTLYTILFGFLTFERCEIWRNGETLWTDVVNQYPSVAVGYYNRGIYYRKHGQLEKALADYDKTIWLKPDYTEAYNNRGNVYYTEYNQPEKAIVDYNKAISLDPNSAKGYFNRGQAYIVLKRYDLALQDLNKALELNPDHEHALNNRAGIHVNMRKDYESALRDLSQAIELNPRSGLYYINRSKCYKSLNNKSQALQDALRAQQLGITLDPGYLDSLK